MITNSDNDILEKLDPNSPLTDENIKLLGWKYYCTRSAMRLGASSDYVNIYTLEDIRDSPKLFKNYRINALGEQVYNGYFFSIGGGCSHCRTVAELIETMKN